MQKHPRLTNNASESAISPLISGDKYFVIPYFQRPYRWKTDKLVQFNRDLLGLIDESDDIHFLGAIIVHGRKADPSDPNPYEVIDGQQRLTTLFIYLCAIIKVLCDHKKFDEAAGLFQKYLVVRATNGAISNIKLHSCKEDRAQVNWIFNRLLESTQFQKKLSGFKFVPLTAFGKPKGQIRKNYWHLVEFLEEQIDQEGLPRIKAIYKALLDQITVVQIDVWDPTNGPKIFDSLNSKQQPMTIGDLVRNEVFSRVADEKEADIEQIDHNSWQPFYNKFHQGGKNLFDSYFFPYGLIRDPNVRKSDVYAQLRDQWRHVEDPRKIIKSLSDFQDAFLDLACGTNLQKHEKQVAASFRRLYLSNSPSSIYPFFMQLSNAIKSGKVSRATGIEVIEVVESFLVRRAICGHEPTGLHSVFKRLWVDCKKQPTAKLVAQAIRRHRTVVWPGDNELVEAVRRRPLYGAAIAEYVLGEFDRSLKGDLPTEIPWIEHVLPETLSKDWSAVFDTAEHEELKDLFANLIPLSSKMNAGIGNKGYAHKRARYAKDSMFKSARQFASSYKKWTPQNLESRGNLLANWAKKRWSW